MLLRGLVIIILLLNLGYFAWTQHWLSVIGLEPMSVGEPERLQQQIHSQAVRVEKDTGEVPVAPLASETSLGDGGESVTQ